MNDSEQEKIKVDYKKLKDALKDPKIRKKIDEVYEIDTRFNILMAISNFGSANIKKLARLLDKNDATIYYHIKDMKKDPALLEIDVEMTDSNKGIYYKLTKLAQRHFGEPTFEDVDNKMMKAFDMMLNQSDEEIYRIYMEMLVNHPKIGQQATIDRGRVAYCHILENIMLRNLEEAEHAFIEGKKPLNPSHPLGSIAIFPLDMKISKPRHIFEILRLLIDLASKFNKLKESIKEEMDKNKIPENERIDVHYHLIGGEISEFEFGE